MAWKKALKYHVIAQEARALARFSVPIAPGEERVGNVYAAFYKTMSENGHDVLQFLSFHYAAAPDKLVFLDFLFNVRAHEKSVFRQKRDIDVRQNTNRKFGVQIKAFVKANLPNACSPKKQPRSALKTQLKQLLKPLDIVKEDLVSSLVECLVDGDFLGSKIRLSTKTVMVATIMTELARTKQVRYSEDEVPSIMEVTMLDQNGRPISAKSISNCIRENSRQHWSREQLLVNLRKRSSKKSPKWQGLVDQLFFQK